MAQYIFHRVSELTGGQRESKHWLPWSREQVLETLGKEKAEELFARIPAQAQASAGQQAETSPAAAAAQAAPEPAHRVPGRQPGNAAPEKGNASPSNRTSMPSSHASPSARFICPGPALGITYILTHFPCSVCCFSVHPCMTGPWPRETQGRSFLL